LSRDFLRPPTGVPDATVGEGRGVEVLQCGLDRGPRDARGLADLRDAAVAQGAGLDGEEEPSLPLIEQRQDRGELLFESLISDHASSITDEAEL
jgi:hypothetical protein